MYDPEKEKAKILPYEEQLKLCKKLKKRIDHRLGYQGLIKKYSRTELREALNETQRLSSELKFKDRGLSRIVWQLMRALATPNKRTRDSRNN